MELDSPEKDNNIAQMEGTSQYGEILGFFDRSETQPTNIHGESPPEPHMSTTTQSMEEFDETMVRINQGIESITEPILEPDSTPATSMGDRGNIKLSIMEIKSLHELYSNYIGEMKPQESASFNQLLEKLREHLNEKLSKEERSKIEEMIGTDMGGLIETLIKGWMTPIYEAISNDNVTIESHLKDLESIAENALKNLHDLRNEDRKKMRRVGEDLMDTINIQNSEITQARTISINSKTIVQTKHEQMRAEHEDRYKSAMNGLNKIAMGLIDTTKAIRHYSNMEIECSTQIHQNINMISLESLTLDASSGTSNDEMKKLELIQDRVSNLGKVYKSLVHCIRGIISSKYSITSSINKEKTMSLLSNKEFELPIGLDKGPNPIVAQQLVSSIRTLLHSIPRQTWAIHPTLERIFVDTSKASIHWSPPQLDGAHFKWSSIRQFYKQQNKALFEILERRNFNAVHKSYHTLITGDIDDRGGDANSRGGKDDAVGIIGWWIRYHTKSGFKDRQKIKDVFNHAFGPFGDSDIPNTIEKLRELIPSVRRLGIKLSYESVVTQSVNILQSRHPSFISSLEDFKRIPDERYEDDAIDIVDAFLSRVERIVQSIHHTVPKTRTSDVQYARAIFDSGMAHISKSPQTPPMDETKESAFQASPPPYQGTNHATKDTTCRGKGCKQEITKYWIDRLGGVGDRTLCPECFISLRRHGSIVTKNGKTITTTNPKKEGMPQQNQRILQKQGHQKRLIHKANRVDDKPKHNARSEQPTTKTLIKSSTIEETNDPLDNTHQDFEEGVESSFQHTAMMIQNIESSEESFDTTTTNDSKNIDMTPRTEHARSARFVDTTRTAPEPQTQGDTSGSPPTPQVYCHECDRAWDGEECDIHKSGTRGAWTTTQLHATPSKHTQPFQCIFDSHGELCGSKQNNEQGTMDTRHLKRCEHHQCMRYCDDYTKARYCDMCANIEGAPDWKNEACGECYIAKPHETTGLAPEPREKGTPSPRTKTTFKTSVPYMRTFDDEGTWDQPTTSPSPPMIRNIFRDLAIEDSDDIEDPTTSIVDISPPQMVTMPNNCIHEKCVRICDDSPLRPTKCGPCSTTNTEDKSCDKCMTPFKGFNTTMETSQGPPSRKDASDDKSPTLGPTTTQASPCNTPQKAKIPMKGEPPRTPSTTQPTMDITPKTIPEPRDAPWEDGDPNDVGSLPKILQYNTTSSKSVSHKKEPRQTISINVATTRDVDASTPIIGQSTPQGSTNPMRTMDDTITKEGTLTIECPILGCVATPTPCASCDKFTTCPQHYHHLACPKCTRPRRPRLMHPSIAPIHAAERTKWEESNEEWLRTLDTKLKGRRRELNKRRSRIQRAKAKLLKKGTNPTTHDTPLARSRCSKRIKTRNVTKTRREHTRDNNYEMDQAQMDRAKDHQLGTCVIEVPHVVENIDPIVEGHEQNSQTTTRPTTTRWYAPCSTPGCPCMASFNGQDNEACGKHCRTHGPCEKNDHYFPKEIPKGDALRQPYANIKDMIRDTHQQSKVESKRTINHPLHCQPSKARRKALTRA